MTPAELDAIRARAEAATPGPWWDTEALSDDEDAAWGVGCGEAFTDRFGIVAMTCGTAAFDQGNGMDLDREANVEFIAHARQDIPVLLAEVDRLHEQIDTARRMVSDIQASLKIPIPETD